MKITVYLRSGWRSVLSVRLIDQLQSFLQRDPVGRESMLFAPAEVRFVRMLQRAGVAGRFMFLATVDGLLLANGECSDTSKYISVSFDQTSATRQVVRVSGEDLDWVAAAMGHLCSGGHFAAPFAVLAMAQGFGLYKQLLHPLERLLLTAALTRYDWNLTKTARELGVHRSTMYDKFRRLGLSGVRELRFPKLEELCSPSIARAG